MCINPPEAAAVATIYQIWKRTERTSAWECLGDTIAILACAAGGWSGVQQFASTYLSNIPVQHIKLAYADHNIRAAHLTLNIHK